MKQLLKFPTVLILVFCATLMVSCKDHKESHDHDGDGHNHSKEMAYACPMDCEDGKTYKEMGSCPVCKMDLKQVEKHSHDKAKSCTMHKDGKCSHPEGECDCSECPMHAKDGKCKMHADGTCTHDQGECDCEDCPVHNKE